MIPRDLKQMERQYQGTSTFYAKNLSSWRRWLNQHHQTQTKVWLVIYHKASKTPSVYYDEAVDEALCFGWIDSKPNKRDHESYYQFFARRNPKSLWSRVNKEKIMRLKKENRIQPAGLEMIRQAKNSGTWDALNDVENLVIPTDLKAAFDKFGRAAEIFDSFPRSVKRGILEWIFQAKRPTTREKRIEETARLAAQGIRANQFRK